MPELPEVEVTRLRLMPELTGRRFEKVEIRVAKLRMPVPQELGLMVEGRTLRAIERRGKYLLFDCATGWLLIHLGMTGYLQLLPAAVPPGKHDHLDCHFNNGKMLRFHDPRKFGTVLWLTGDPLLHPLLASIGPEPLSERFNGSVLHSVGKSRKVAIKQLIMDSQVVAGVGNIYANEALFMAGISPERVSASVTVVEFNRLAEAIQQVLGGSVARGSSLRVMEDSVAYFPLDNNVYGRGGEPCRRCGDMLVETRQGNRSTVFCRSCQG